MFAFFKKQGHQNKNQQGTTFQKVTVNITKLKAFLGGQDNIMQVEVTLTKIKIFIKTMQKVNVKGIRGLKSITGVFLSHHYITIIVGKQAKELTTLLIKT